MLKLRGAEVKRDAAGYTEELSRRDIEIVLDPDGMGSSTLNTYPEGILKAICLSMSYTKYLSRRDRRDIETNK